MNIIEHDENDRLTISKEASSKLSKLMSDISSLKAEESELRKEILEEMIANNIERCTVEGLSFTQVQPKPICFFDEDAFLLNEHESITKIFTNVEEVKAFDEERFKTEQPDLYNQYLKSDIQTHVMTDMLQKALPTIFKKYYSETESDKKVTLRVSASKGERK